MPPASQVPEPIDFAPMISSLYANGCTISGDPVLEISIRSAGGKTLLIELPNGLVKRPPELPRNVVRYCDKIKKYLAACEYPVRTKDLEINIYGGERGGPFGQALAHLRERGDLITRDGLNADDAAKFAYGNDSSND